MVFEAVKKVSALTRIIKIINYPLLIGGCVFICVLFACFLGPRLAPQDPLKENYALRVNGNIRQPPYAPFAVEGFPLGTDQYGRDLLSRLLWAVRDGDIGCHYKVNNWDDHRAYLGMVPRTNW
jgi:ABC-type dipeptide/oligopeptide/nickel transport system permease subunit